jgi:hypothetical protein
MATIAQATLALTDGNLASHRTQYFCGPMVAAQAAMRSFDPSLFNLEDDSTRYWDEDYWEKVAKDIRCTDYEIKLARQWAKEFVDEKREDHQIDVTAEIAGYIAGLESSLTIDDKTGCHVTPYIGDPIGIVKERLTQITNSYIQMYTAQSTIKEIQAQAAKGPDSGDIINYNQWASPQQACAQDVVATIMEYAKPGAGLPLMVGGTAGATASAGTLGALVASGAVAETGLLASIGLGVLATPIGAGVAIFGLLALATYAVGVGINKFTTWMAEQEPITIMLLNHKGNPFHAGLKGADGIMSGQPATLPLLTQLTGASFPSDEPVEVWNKLGFSLTQARGINEAESILKLNKMHQGVRMAGMLESSGVDGINTNVVVRAQIKEVYDGDTIYTQEGIKIAGISLPDATTIRMKYIDAPEMTKKQNEVYGGKEFGAEEVRDWLARRLQSTTVDKTHVETGDVRHTYHKEVKLIINKLQPFDNYDRTLAIVVDRTSCSRYDDDAYLASQEFNWLYDSINGEMIRLPELRQYVSPFLTYPGFTEATQASEVGDYTGRFYIVNVSPEEEVTQDE